MTANYAAAKLLLVDLDWLWLVKDLSYSLTAHDICYRRAFPHYASLPNLNMILR